MREYSFKKVKENRLPPGRVPEYLAKFTEEEKHRTAIKPGPRLGDDDTVKMFPNRKAMAQLIRKEERPYSSWRPVVKLTDGEGY